MWRNESQEWTAAKHRHPVSLPSAVVTPGTPVEYRAYLVSEPHEQARHRQRLSDLPLEANHEAGQGLETQS